MRHILRALASVALLAALALPSLGQHLGDVALSSGNQKVFAAQSTAATTPLWTVNCVPTNGAPCGVPQGNSVHFVTYTIAGGGVGGANLTELAIRLEGSNDGSTFFPISDTASDLLSGSVFAVGSYPVIRVNLAVFRIAAGTPTITAAYAGTAGTVPVATGIINPSQSYKVNVFDQLPSNANQTLFSIPAPFGSTLGYIVVTGQTAAIPGGSSVTAQAGVFGSNPNVWGVNLAATTALQILPMPHYPASTIGVTYTSGGASAGTFTLTYVFVSPSLPNGLVGPSIQSPATLNSETTSAVNTAITKVIGNTSIASERVHLYSVSARCSAGTAQLSVLDNVTQIWSTSATEVGTTTFKFQWNPGLTNSMGASMTITLGTCGAANTGVLDVQASQF